MLLTFQSAVSPVDRLQQVEQFCSNSLLPFLKSWGFTSILANLRWVEQLYTNTCPSEVLGIYLHPGYPWVVGTVVYQHLPFLKLGGFTSILANLR